jgi:hypothetical protein
MFEFWCSNWYSRWMMKGDNCSCLELEGKAGLSTCFDW